MEVAARVRRVEVSPATFRRLAVAAVAWLWLIVLTGATVRLTSSGLGCHHWPGCTGTSFVPTKSYHSFIEFGNRIMSGLTILAALAAAVGAYFAQLPRWTKRLALATFIGTFLQAPLGAITVYAGLNPFLVMTHLLLALVVLAGGVVVAVEAVGVETGRAHVRLPETIRRASFVLAAALLALIVTGTLATAAGPHPGSTHGDKLVHRLWHLHAAVYVHVRATAVFGLLFLAGLVWLWRNRARWPLYWEGAAALLFLFLVQMGIGELQYRTKLPWWLVLVHVGTAAAVWAWTVALVALAQRPPTAFEPH